jgi:AraC-like DNA-binding protein
MNPPLVTVVEIRDPAAANAGIELIDLDAVQLQSMPLRARRVVVRTGATTIVFHSANLRLRTRTTISEGQVGYVTFGPRSRGTINGIPVRPGMMLAAAPQAAARFVVEADWESVTILLPPQDLLAHLAARRRDSGFHLPLGIETLAADPPAASRLFDWCKRLAEAALAQPILLNGGAEDYPALQIEVVEHLLAAIGDARALAPDRSERTRQRHSLIVKTAEEFALAQSGSNLYVSDLCHASGVSERTLEYAFREILGLTPMAYLTRLRLHRVRRALLLANPDSTTVATEALRWGFWHFGDFARAYHDCFAELPSETLARQGNGGVSPAPGAD